MSSGGLYSLLYRQQMELVEHDLPAVGAAMNDG
jgi:hypothetical protein